MHRDEGRGDAQEGKEAEALTRCDLASQSTFQRRLLQSDRNATHSGFLQHGFGILDCGHSTYRMLSDNQTIGVCLDCIEGWIDNQMRNPEAGVA